MKVKLKSILKYIARTEIHAVSHRYLTRGKELVEVETQAGSWIR
jgi:hypothetical protein